MLSSSSRQHDDCVCSDTFCASLSNEHKHPPLLQYASAFCALSVLSERSRCKMAYILPYTKAKRVKCNLLLLSRCMCGVQAGGATSSGPAAGTGLELILQGFNWESCKGDWYKVRLCSAAVLAWLPLNISDGSSCHRHCSSSVTWLHMLAMASLFDTSMYMSLHAFIPGAHCCTVSWHCASVQQHGVHHCCDQAQSALCHAVFVWLSC